MVFIYEKNLTGNKIGERNLIKINFQTTSGKYIINYNDELIKKEKEIKVSTLDELEKEISDLLIKEDILDNPSEYIKIAKEIKKSTEEVILKRYPNHIEKTKERLPIPIETTDTNVTTDTTDTTPLVSSVTCVNDPQARIFGDNTLEKIMQFLTQNKGVFTYDKLAEELGKTEGSIRTSISRNKALFLVTKENGKVCNTSLTQAAIDEIDQRILNYNEKIKAEKELEEKVKQKEEAKNLSEETLIIEFKGFIESHKDIIGNSKDSVVIINFKDLSEHSPIIAESLLEEPEKTLPSFEVAIEESGLIDKCRIRIVNLPESELILIEELRSKHLNKFFSVSGKIIQSSDARPQTVNARFECPSCGTIISVLQLEKKFREPSRCSCGRRGSFTLKSKEMVDTARFILQDLHEESQSSNPKKLNCFVKEDLASSHVLNNIIQAGNDVIVNGTLKEVPVPLASGGISTRHELALEVNHIKMSEEEVELDKLSEDEIEDFEKLAHRIDEKGLSELTPSFAPVVIGYEYVKQALMLYPCNSLNNPGIDDERNKSNFLLIGDPSTAKSVLARFLTEVVIGSEKVVGGSASAVGITGAAIKDEFLGGWMINPGALVLAKGLLFLEELNTMADEEKAKIQDAMESQYVDITKANARGRFKVRTGIVACANPIKGHFMKSNNKQDLITQFNIPSPILSRFDAVFLFRDIVDKERDFKISRNMMKRKNKLLESEFDKNFLKKFFFYTQHRNEPKWDEDFEILSARVYSIIREICSEESNVNSRVSEAMNRMCVASAKIRGSDTLEERDLERAINILSNSYFAIPEYSIIKQRLIK